jgi:amino-acid N-acetyltransferase
VSRIRQLLEPFIDNDIVLDKPPVSFYETIQEFSVAKIDEEIVGCGALHVFWEDLAEIRSLAVDKSAQGHGVGSAIVSRLISRARQIGVKRVFCLTFETKFFSSFGFQPIDGIPVTKAVFNEMLNSYDEGTAEFLNLERVKPNTLGNTRMLLYLNDAVPSDTVTAQPRSVKSDTATSASPDNSREEIRAAIAARLQS